MHACLLPSQFSKNWLSLRLHFLFPNFNAVSLEPCVQRHFLPSLESVRWPTTPRRTLAILYYRLNMFLNWLILPIMSSLLGLLLAISNTATTSPFTIFLYRQNSCCPVKFLLEYLARRGNRPRSLFLTPDYNPVSRIFFADLLSLSLKACGLDSTRYKGHSFRIGTASFAAERGMCDAQIRALGRWKSNDFLKYIRIPSLST